MSQPVPKDPPHPEIEMISVKVLDEYRKQFRYFATKPTDFLQDVIASANDFRAHTDFSIRVGAEVNRAAALMVLEDRKLTYAGGGQ